MWFDDAEIAPSRADLVFDYVGAEIFSGKLAPGDVLPTENELTETFSVNRHVVREAIQRLEQVGLVKASRGGRTRVLDYTRHAGLDLLGTLAKHHQRSQLTLQMWHSGLQMRAAIAVDVARMCAMKRDPALAGELLSTTARMQDAPDGQSLLALHIEFWDAAIAGADNLAYRLAFNTLLRVAQSAPVPGMFTREELVSSNFLQPLAVAIASGDVAAAEREARAAMTLAVDQLANLIDQSKAGVESAIAALSAKAPRTA